jgi:hypothetical protein
MIAILVTLGVCAFNNDSCYDYGTQTVVINPATVTPYSLTHEVGHAHYFTVLTDQQRHEVAVNDPRVRNEEAYADVFAACILGKGPRWMRSNGYGVRVGHQKFKRLCRMIKGLS